MMKKQMLHPQEIEVFYLLPALRRQLAMSLKEKGIEQKKIAEWLSLTPAAVSQYISGKRGKEVKLPDSLKKAVEKEINTIKDSVSAYSAIQRLSSTATSSGVLCKIHCSMDSSLPKNCTLCKRGM
jgi:predicted transcriptional regulator